jgi:4-hydroxy-3-methylbut-2-en-1-yl diphosphate reductase
MLAFGWTENFESQKLMDVVLANPRGFCAGVDRAIDIVERALDIFGAPIYVRHEVVHNRFVVEKLRARGAIFVDDLEEVPADQTVIFSAHGVSQAVRQEASARGLRIFDATCPLVTKVHMEVARLCKAGKDVVLIGHHGHPEVEGTLGQWDCANAKGRIYLIDSIQEAQALVASQPDNLAYTTQTTLSVDETKEIIGALMTRFPSMQGPRNDDICYATQNRQDAVRALAEQCDLVLVVGSPNSSNSNRLRELAEKVGVESYLIDGAHEIKADWLRNKRAVGVTAGASAPESLVQEVLLAVQAAGGKAPREIQGAVENMVFALPKELRVVVQS